MSLACILAKFQDELYQCELLIQHIHMQDKNKHFVFPLIDQRQVTVAAFLNMFIAWEGFLESAFSEYMMGEKTISGRQPIRYVFPPTADAAKGILIGTQRFFDYGNHEFVIKAARLYFKDGEPFEPHLSGIVSDLSDMRTMRNWSAHITSTTQTALEGLAQRIFTKPKPNIDLYTLLISDDPRDGGNKTVISCCKDKLFLCATLISQ